MSFAGETIWIIGASSGIGRALALKCAAENANLIISARRKSELDKLASQISRLSPEINVHISPLDVAKDQDVQKAAERLIGRVGKIDRIIFMAAIYNKPGPVKDVKTEDARKVMEVNFLGALNVAKTAMSLFEKQSSGQIAMCGSVAGYMGLPRGQVYSASKAAMINLTETLSAEAPPNIDIKLISPGFVETPMTDINDFDMPMIITPETAAEAISKGLRSNSFEIHFPKKFTLLTKLLNILPYWLSLPITKRINL